MYNLNKWKERPQRGRWWMSNNGCQDRKYCIFCKQSNSVHFHFFSHDQFTKKEIGGWEYRALGFCIPAKCKHHYLGRKKCKLHKADLYSCFVPTPYLTMPSQSFHSSESGLTPVMQFSAKTMGQWESIHWTIANCLAFWLPTLLAPVVVNTSNWWEGMCAIDLSLNWMQSMWSNNCFLQMLITLLKNEMLYEALYI